VVAIFCERLQSAEELTIFGDGEQTRDYVYVKDVVVANLLASEMVLKPGPDIDAVAFNVGTGAGTSVNRLADVLESIAENRPGRVYREARAGELRHSTLDVSRFAECGWAARHTLEDSLRETFHFIANQKIGA
jgi:UDP-glucose 4-epimerase